jgi:hypothetical protein
MRHVARITGGERVAAPIPGITRGLCFFFISDSRRRQHAVAG